MRNADARQQPTKRWLPTYAAASCLRATCSARLIACRAPAFSRIGTDTADSCGLRLLVHAQIENGSETRRSDLNS